MFVKYNVSTTEIIIREWIYPKNKQVNMLLYPFLVNFYSKKSYLSAQTSKL